MIKGTHNSMTFLKPKKWIFRLFTPFWRCQSKDLFEQFDMGARCFDFRVRLNKKTKELEFGHGIVSLKCDHSPVFEIMELLWYADQKNANLKLRLILEDLDATFENRLAFTEMTNTLEAMRLRTFNNFELFGGNRKGDWAQIKYFPYTPDLRQYVGSMADDARWYEKFIPIAYARRKNKDNLPKSDGDIAIYDFI